MTFIVVLAAAALAAVIAMSVAVQRRSGGYYAHRTGLDKPGQATPEQQAGTLVDFPLHHP